MVDALTSFVQSFSFSDGSTTALTSFIQSFSFSLQPNQSEVF